MERMKFTLDLAPRFALLVLVSLAIGLTGCGSPSMVKRNDPVPEGRGMVVVHVASGAVEDKNWDWLEFWSESEKKVYYLYREAPNESGVKQFPSTAHFSGALPPGTYRIDALKSQTHTQHYVLTYTAQTNDKLGQFKVEAGALTDLGTIVYYPAGGGLSSGAFGLFLASGSDTARAVENRNPVAFAALDRKPSLGWVDTKGAVSPDTLSEIATNLPRINPFFEAQNGDIYAGGLLGRIFKRNSSGRWRTLDTGTLQEIFRVQEADGVLYATSERMVLKSEDEGRSWTPESLPSQAGRLEFFHAAPDGTQYLYRLADPGLVNTFHLYRRSSQRADWALIANNTFDSGKMDLIRPSLYRIDTSGGLSFAPGRWNNYVLDAGGNNITRDAIIGYSTLRYFDKGEIYAIDLDFEFALKSPQTTPCLEFYDPVQRKNERRHCWEKDSDIEDMFFLDRTTGYVAIKGPRDASSVLVKTADGGKSWETLPGTEGTRLVYVTEDGTILTATFGGTIQSSTDGGKRWKRERSPANLIAGSRQAKP